MKNNINLLKVGQSFELSKIFTQEEVETFSNLSLDKNPIHLSEEYASQSFFKRRIVHGFLVGSLISAVIGNYLPGEGSIYMTQTLKFIRPVYVGDKVTARVEITDIDLEKSIIKLNTIAFNESNNLIEGEAKIKLLSI